jgi:hypothetical protein
MTFQDAVRSKVIKLHTRGQLANTIGYRVTKPNFLRYMIVHKNIHNDLRGFAMEAPFADALERDVARLRSEVDVDVDIDEPRAVPDEASRKLAWWYCVVGAHVVGGSAAILKAADINWTPEYYVHDITARDVKESFDASVEGWDATQKQRCLEEIPRVFDYLNLALPL